MGNVLIEEGHLSNIANAIRAKTGGEELLYPGDMASEIESIQSGGGNMDALIDRSVTEVTSNAVSIGDHAFDKCGKLTSVNFPKVTNIGYRAFYECRKLSSVDFPEVASVAGGAFTYCTSLKNINMPKVTTLASSAFWETKPSRLDFPVLSSIAQSVFYYCVNLVALILRKSDSICTLSNKNAFGSSPIGNGTGYIYVPQALIETYKTATNWATYADQFRAIEEYPDICEEVE